MAEPILLQQEEIKQLQAQDWQVVSSSWVKAVKKVGNDLKIWFHTGEILVWKGLAPIHYKPLLGALSKGRYVYFNLKDKHNLRER